MMVKVNETVSINHEIPSPTAFMAEKLYLGNFPTDSADVFTPQSSPRPSTTTLTTTVAAVTIEDQTTTFSPEFAEEEGSDTTISPSLFESSQAPETSTVLSTQPPVQTPSSETDATLFNEIGPNNDVTVESNTGREDIEPVII